MTKIRRPRLTKENLGFLASQAKWMLRDVEGTQAGRRWKSILDWTQEMLQEPEPEQLTNGKEAKP